MVLAGLAATSLGCAAENPDTTEEKAEHHATSSLRFFFSSEVTKGYGCGDCILIEHTDPNGAKLFGLVDTGRSIETQGGTSTVTLDYLAAHEVTSLEFLVVTHQHADHMEDAARILASMPVRTLFMKQYDVRFSSGMSQEYYEEILRTAFEHGVHVVGVDPRSLYPGAFGTTLCPSMSKSFRDWLATNQGLVAQSEPFNESNKQFTLGDASFALINWESWDANGNPWDMSSGLPHEYTNNENNSSLGLVMRFGTTSALLAGDMNNNDAQRYNGIGDEERVATGIGLIDFFKLNHHGYNGSNTVPFLNALLPKHVLITNDVGFVYGATKSWLDDHGVDYAFTTSDPMGMIVTFDGTDVRMAPEMRERFVRSASDLAFIPSSEEDDPLPVIFEERSTTARSWEELASLIRENASAWNVDQEGAGIAAESMRIDISELGACEANSCITVETGQRVAIVTSQEAVIRRAPGLMAEPLFMVKGELAIEGPLTLDGNKAVVERCTASLIVNEDGILTLSGVTLQNNDKHHDTEKMGMYESICFGGALLSLFADTTLTNGTTLSNNTCLFDEELHIEFESITWICGGGALAALGGTLTIEDATLAHNECIARVAFVLDFHPDDVTVQHMVTRGGGLYLANGVACTCTKLALEDNRATDASYLVNGEGYSYATRIRGCGCFANNASVEIRESLIRRNQTGNDMRDIDARGAGISIESGTLALHNTMLAENTGVTRGGALSVDGAHVTLRTCSVSYNAAAMSAGGIFVADKGSSRLHIERCRFEADWAQGSDGGAIWSEAPMVIRDSSFIANSAARCGGALYSSGGIFVDNRTSFSDNAAATGNDVCVGGEAAGFYSIGPTADCVYGPQATPNPPDNGPNLSAYVLPRRTHSDGAAIDISATTATGLAELRINGQPFQRNRYVARKAGTYLIEAIDLAGRVASQKLDVSL